MPSETRSSPGRTQSFSKWTRENSWATTPTFSRVRPESGARATAHFFLAGAKSFGALGLDWRREQQVVDAVVHYASGVRKTSEIGKLKPTSVIPQQTGPLSPYLNHLSRLSKESTQRVYLDASLLGRKLVKADPT